MRGRGRAAPAAWVLAVALGLSAAGLHGQPGGPDMPVLEGLRPLSEVPVLATPAVVRSPSRTEAAPGGGPVPFAEPFAVAVTPARRGVWEETSDGRFAVWRLRVTSPGALSLNFGFTRYRMPRGGSLRIRAAEGGESIGPFTDADNEAHGQLWTPVVSGGDAVIEVAVPAGREEELELELTSVNRGFRDLFPAVVRTPGHASCQIDVACTEADPYRDQVRSVGLLVHSGYYACSGVLINNTARDRKPYFMTAGHCISAAAAPSVVVYWNYESPTCGARSGGSKAHWQSGATLVARNRRCPFGRASYGQCSGDGAILLLDDDVSPAHDLFFAGWNADPAPPSSSFMVHHPGAHVKSIAFGNRQHSLGAGGLWVLPGRWTRGGAEGGSSGSPYFGPDGRVVAVHSGNGPGCGNESWGSRLANDWLGRGADLPSGRFLDWLDPVGTGEMAIDGMPWNYPPEAAGTLHGKSLRLADGALEVDVAHGFLDRDGDALVFTVSSSDETIATAAITGSTVTVSPVAAGTVTVTVTASDGKTDDLSRTFAVTVGANRSPEPVGTLAALALSLADGAASVDVSAAFEDDDGDTLTYAASSSDESVATVSVSGSTVTVTPVSGGRAVIAVTATDAAGSNTSARQGFEAAVASRPPETAGTLPSLSLVMKLGGKGKEIVDLRPAFRDPDGDLLTWSASSSDDSMASVSMWRWWATVTPVAAGSATITVSATDPAGSNSATSRTFAVTVANGPPEVLGLAVRKWDMRRAAGSGAIDLTKMFGDPDGDALAFAATSADPAVATVAVAGTTATVSPKAFGSTVLTATATDTGGSNTTVSNRVTLRVLNSPPESTRKPRAIRMVEGGPDRYLDMAAHFRDPDGDVLTWGCGSNSAQVAACGGFNGDVLAISAGKSGTAALSLEARDQGGSGSRTVASLSVVVAPTPRVAVSFGSASHEVTEGGTVTVEVLLGGDAKRDLEIVLERTHHGGATDADYSGVPSSVRFASGQTSRTFEVAAADDALDDDGEAVALGFASLPYRVSGGAGTTIAILDNDDGGPPTGGPPTGGPPTGGPPTGGPPTGGPGGPGGPPPPPDDEEDDEDDGDDGGPPPGGPPPGGGGPPRAEMETDAECEAGLCLARTGERVSFEDASAGSVRSRMWEFGDGRRSSSASPSHAWASPGFHEVALVVSDGSVESTASLMFLVEAAEAAGACAADEWTRCLGDSRFAVTVDWRGAGGETGRGRVAPAGTNESAMFQFFDASNWEVLVKVLDGCEANGHAWVFGASTTDLGYVIRVTDTAMGAVKEFRNEPGTPAPAITDVKAFPEGCR